MGSGGSVEARGVQDDKLRNLLVMKAFNLKKRGTSLEAQFQNFKQRSEDGVEYVDCAALCDYLKIPEHRKRAVASLFQANQSNKIPVELLVQFLQTGTIRKATVSENQQKEEETPAVKLQLIVRDCPKQPIVQISKPPAQGLWKKREITIQEKIVEYTKIDEDGVPQNLIETEKQQLEVVHMETVEGEFAHREITHFEQYEKLNDEIINHQEGKEEFVHFKSKHDEFSHFESSMPQTEECEGPPPSPSLKPGQDRDRAFPTTYPEEEEAEDDDLDFGPIPGPRISTVHMDEVEPINEDLLNAEIYTVYDEFQPNDEINYNVPPVSVGQ